MSAYPAVYDRLLDHFRTAPDRDGEVWVTCPACGKERDHFSFSPRGAHCFKCGYKDSLSGLARRVGLWDDQPRRYEPYVPPPPKPARRAPWLAEASERLTRYVNHPDLLARWQAYKPISAATVRRFRFGLGKLPMYGKRTDTWYESRDDWLIVPLFEGTKLVALRGRNLTGQGPKWISASGSRYALFGLETVEEGDVVWICENYVDAAWLMERYPDMRAVAIGGASNWKDEWAQALAAKQPRLVVVALDFDLAGQAHGKMYERLQAERRAEGLPPIEPAGPRIANDLLARGLHAHLFRWPEDAPAKADIGWLLAQQGGIA